ncbi:hypothetical protein [Cellulophaga sp. BC115SP]|uniref:hypothetical protein n=1 Tax=Cellulophaga sp. BC115SP TaxID=2683263 RepID=UPI0014133CE3|nr:hypothetical protein [Cellulophaga sp. BC115SP]NBB32042.1 hypothetical protein [Cellulophaga sp. BC115SP]
MKKSQIILLISLLGLFACQGQNKENNKKQVIEYRVATENSYELAYHGFNFTPFLSDFTSNDDTDSTNVINIELPYKEDSLNHFGQGRGFMIHKKGIKYWFNYAQTKYRRIGKYDNINYGYSSASKMLMGKDSVLLKDFNKWIFFIDRKYLRAIPGTGEWDAGSPEALANKPLPEEYYPKLNSKIEILLLEQKAGENVWHIIDRATFDTDEYGGYKPYIDKNNQERDLHGEWINSFQERKIKENQ